MTLYVGSPRGSPRDKMKLRVTHIIAFVCFILICSALLVQGAPPVQMRWQGFFGGITLQDIQTRDQVSTGSSSITLVTTGDAEISAENGEDARLTEPEGDSLYTEYKLEFDGDGASSTGGTTVNFTSYDSFLTSPAQVTHVLDDDQVTVTLSVRASNYANQLANAGTYSATQTLTAAWVGP